MLSDMQNLSYSIFITKAKYLGGDIVTEANKVGKLIFWKLAGENDFDTTAAKIAGFHHAFVLPFQEVAQFLITADFYGVAVQYQKRAAIFKI